MQLTQTERLLLANQNRILALLDEDNSINHLFKAEILENGYEGLFHECFESISEGVSDETCRETHDILTMYYVINNLIGTLSDDQKASLQLDKITFKGFDANNDDHYGFMNFLIDKANLYKDLKDKYLNSHSISSIEKYRRMLPLYNEALKANNYTLDLSGLQNIISKM